MDPALLLKESYGIRVVHSYQRYGRPFQALATGFDQLTGWLSALTDDGAPLDLAVLAAVRGRWLTAEALRQEVRCNRSRLYDTLKRLIDDGQIDRRKAKGRGAPRLYTAAGGDPPAVPSQYELVLLPY